MDLQHFCPGTRHLFPVEPIEPAMGRKLMDHVMKRDNIGAEHVKKFRDLCILARALFVHYNHLVDNDAASVFRRTAPIFFGDVCHALRAQIFLQVCALTDPGDRNLTVDFFIRNMNPAPDRLSSLSDRLHAFRNQIKPARDKLISHFDRNTELGGNAIGGVDLGKWKQFWIDLQEFVYVLSNQLLNEPICINAVSNQSDVPALLAALQTPT